MIGLEIAPIIPERITEDQGKTYLIVHINVTFLGTAREKVSETFGYRHLEDFMASHLDYLVLEWLNLQDTEYSLSSFPFILLNYTNIEDFYR